MMSNKKRFINTYDLDDPDREDLQRLSDGFQEDKPYWFMEYNKTLFVSNKQLTIDVCKQYLTDSEEFEAILKRGNYGK